MTWRSPARVPPLVDPASVSWPESPIARLLLGGAWRGRAHAHALAHGLRRVPGPAQRVVLAAVEAALASSEAFASAAKGHGVGDVERFVEARLVQEPLPYAESWAEVAIADVLFAGALAGAADALVRSSDARIADAARVARGVGPSFGKAILAELAADPPNHGCLQLLVDRWMPAAVMAFGRPESPADAKLFGAGIKTERSADALRRFLESAERDMNALSLYLPDGLQLGLVVPEGWTPHRRSGPWTD